MGVPRWLRSVLLYIRLAFQGTRLIEEIAKPIHVTFAPTSVTMTAGDEPPFPNFQTASRPPA